MARNVVNENSRARTAWDLLILVLIVVSCTLVPYQLAFRHHVDLAGSLVVYLIEALEPQVFAPGVVIAREGEAANGIYFISQGKVETTSDEERKAHGTLEGGDYFGDLSTLLGERRTASVRTLSYCDVFLLKKKDFEQIKREYGEFRDVLKRISTDKTETVAALVLDGVIL